MAAHRIPVTARTADAVKGRGAAVPGRCYEALLHMDLWVDLERRIRQRNVRVDERLALLALLRDGEEGALAARRSELMRAVDQAARRLLDEAGGA